MSEDQAMRQLRMAKMALYSIACITYYIMHYIGYIIHIIIYWI